MVVVEAGGAWAAREVATAAGVVLIPWTVCRGQRREGGQIVQGLRLALSTTAPVICPFPASLFTIGALFYLGAAIYRAKKHIFQPPQV